MGFLSSYLTAQLLHKCSCFRIVVRLFHIFAFGHRINRFKQLLLEFFLYLHLSESYLSFRLLRVATSGNRIMWHPVRYRLNNPHPGILFLF